jgi:recombination protein RecT
MASEREVATYNDRALSLKRYLNNDRIKNQIMEALPKWLSAERFLKVYFGAILRNPKILECTAESILQSAMFFAQLGLEPILGRAYLVPYLNTKNIDGRWVKQYEVQAQVGYQGLIDLARRSDTIADVWGANVYENDLFDLSFGLDRALVHKPWFMDPEKRKRGESGECIGAYIVWQLKDGTKHPDFMPIHEIHKRRARSQAWAYAETGDPQKGGGKRDSVWHQWPEEMNLKTVIKHSSKLVPASIEFMQAVENDDNSDSGKGGYNLDLLGGNRSLPEPGPGDFDSAAQARSDAWPNPDFERFVQATAEGNRKAADQFKSEVMASGRFEEFWGAFVESRRGGQEKGPGGAAANGNASAPAASAETEKPKRGRRGRAAGGSEPVETTGPEAGPPLGPDFEDEPREVGYPSAAPLDALANSPDVKSVHPAGTAAGQGSSHPSGKPPGPNGEAGSVEAMMRSEEYAQLCDLRRTERGIYEEAKKELLGGLGPRTAEECARLIRHIEQAMR